MAKGKVVTALVVSAAAVAGAVLWRRRSRRKERVDLYFADGSMVSLEQGSLEADRLLPHAHQVLAAARGIPAV
jgi:hypothetical protein